MNKLISENLLQKITKVTGLKIPDTDVVRFSELILDRARKLGIDSFEEYSIFLEKSEHLRSERDFMSEALTTPETYFMRDSGQMALLKRKILPDLILRKNKEKHLRIWSAACSSGEEAYSLAILLNEVLPDQADWKIEIFGTDINQLSIEKAIEARYRNWAFRGCDEGFKSRYFKKLQNEWELIDDIKCKVTFFKLDLYSENLPNFALNLADVDLIICRNLFIYMDSVAINLIAKKLIDCLSLDGILMTAHSELMVCQLSGLHAQIYPESIVYSKSETIKKIDSIDLFKMPNQEVFIKDRNEFKVSKVPKVSKELTSNKEVFVTHNEPSIIDAWELADQGRLKEAFDLTTSILRKDPMISAAQYLSAILLIEMGDLEEGRKALRKSLYLDPNCIGAYIDLISIYNKLGESNVAKSICHQAIHVLEKLPPEEELPYFGKGSIADALNYLKHLQNSLTL